MNYDFPLPTSSFIFYNLYFRPPRFTYCAGPNLQEEGIEFAVRVGTSGLYGPWVPIRLTWRERSKRTITKIIRGYEVDSRAVTTTITPQQVTLCDRDLLPVDASEVQFRWMNTANQPGRKDIWALFNVTADVIHTSTGDTYRIFDSK